MKKKILFSLVLSCLLSSGQAFAVNISVFNANTEQAEITNWINGLGGVATVLGGGDLESETAGWYETRSIDGLGTFKAGGLIGTGATSYNQASGSTSTNPYFSIRDTSWYGRKNTTPGGNNYLDSGDITKLALDLSALVTNLFFFIQDPSDVGAITAIESGGSSYSFDSGRPNASLWFVGISAATPISQIVWTTTNQNDGYGLDQFSTVRPVPEPATMLLLGLGLIGLASVGRRRFR